MSFLRLLHGIGDRLGILETIAVPGTPKAARVQTRSVSLRELASEIKSGEIRALADSPAELSVPFDKIFETAGISSDPKDWTIERVQQVVSGESLKDKPREEVRKSLLDRLNAEGVPTEKIVKDAMARDKAMDSYEAFVGEKMKARMETCHRKRLEIESRIRDLQEEIKALEITLKADEEKWREWRKNKRERERELATLVGYVVDHPVITVDDEG